MRQYLETKIKFDNKFLYTFLVTPQPPSNVVWNSFFAISGKVNIRRCAGNWTIEFSHLPWKWRRSLLLERDWGSELVIGGIMDCSSSTAVPVIVGGPWYIYGDCLWGGLGPVQGAWEPPSTLSASPIVVWRRSYRGLLNSSLDLGPNWKTNCGPHTYRAPVGSVPNILGKK